MWAAIAAMVTDEVETTFIQYFYLAAVVPANHISIGILSSAIQ